MQARSVRAASISLGVLTVMFGICRLEASAHPLGNFTINHYARIHVAGDRVRIRYVVDMAEISTIQELQAAGVGDANLPTRQELDRYLTRVASDYIKGIIVSLDGERLALSCTSKSITLPPGAGGLNTLRVECDFEGLYIAGLNSGSHHLRFEDTNHSGRIGWHELVVEPAAGLSVFDSTAYGSAVTDELKAYPQDAIAAPLDERRGEFSFVAGLQPAGSRSLLARDGMKVVKARDRLAELISVPRLTPLAALLGLLVAAALGGLHSLSPGHGKTVVGAYLVGARGTARHAAFLGLTVTITHTAGVFALGLITLFASQYVVPERIFPILSLISGAIVVGIGFSLFLKRLRAALGWSTHSHSNGDGAHGLAHNHGSHAHDHSHGQPTGMHSHDDRAIHSHDNHGDHQHALEGDKKIAHHHQHHSNHIHGPDAGEHHSESHGGHSHSGSGQAHSHEGHAHSHDGHLHPDGGYLHPQDGHVHSHGGSTHSHLPPGTDGSRITWRSLLALGISGGLLPCPSALVVLLASISLHRVGYGLLLVLAFSVGLASVLTSIGLLFVYAGRMMKARSAGRVGSLARIVPVLSSLVITCAGALICWQALGQAGWNVFNNWRI